MPPFLQHHYPVRLPRTAAAVLTLGLMMTGSIAVETTQPAHGAGGNGTVVGNLTLVTLPMPQYTDGRTRTIRIWTPAGYNAKDKTRKYPVLYMHDGQNLFDAATSFAGEWEVDESLTQMMGDGYAGAIVVMFLFVIAYLGERQATPGPDRLDAAMPVAWIALAGIAAFGDTFFAAAVGTPFDNAGVFDARRAGAFAACAAG